ncbi:hypothetical protein MKW94_001370, partial [Papaver nudicaule]|nr:hypothetical protein [Papaver nudicaule]
VLSGIAKNSKDGTFSPVQDSDDLSIVLSMALAEFLNVSIVNLTLPKVDKRFSIQIFKVTFKYSER